MQLCVCVCVCVRVRARVHAHACAPPHLQEPPGAAGYEDVCVAGRLGPPLLVGGGRQRQQGVAVDPEQDGVDHSYAGDGETHPLEEAQELQRHGTRGSGSLPLALSRPGTASSGWKPLPSLATDRWRLAKAGDGLSSTLGGMKLLLSPSPGGPRLGSSFSLPGDRALLGEKEAGPNRPEASHPQTQQHRPPTDSWR